MTVVEAPPCWRDAPAARVRAAIARTMLDEVHGPPEIDETDCCREALLGDVVLRPHQVDAVSRLRRVLDEHGGALLADAVGLGKTYVALALARDARSPLVVAPASLRATWKEAFRRTGTRAPFVSIERLSRRDPPLPAGAPHDLVIVDEAHHLRNPRTRRHAALARLTRRARVLLLSATPVHNSREDLDALVSIFLGSRAAALGDADRARLIVRRGHDALTDARPPRALPLRVLHVEGSDEVTRLILAVPPPAPAADGGVAGALAVHGLLRLWVSSAGALRAGLRRQLTRAAALLAALESGRHLSRAELDRWAVGDGVVQPEFPELLGARGNYDAHASDPDALERAAREHSAGVHAVLLALHTDMDDERARALRSIRDLHPDARIVAFSQFADTVRAYFAMLRHDGGVCALTARGAIVAGGRLSRAEALRRFAPLAHGAPEPPEAERITLLLTTDVASEGLSIVDASVAVHLDTPWTPARLEQRVGRLTRLGSPHAAIAVHAIVASAPLRELVGVERALRVKRDAARRAIGHVGVALPPVPGADNDADVDPEAQAPPDGRTSAAEASERLRVLLGGWVDRDREVPGEGLRAERTGRASVLPLVGAVEAPGPGSPAFLALVAAGDGHRILAGGPTRAPPTDDPRAVLRVACSLHAGRDVDVDPHVGAAAIAATREWIAGERARATIGAVGDATLRLQRRALARIATIVRDAPLHLRPRIAAAAAAARRALTRPLAADAEHQLAELVASALTDEDWLHAIARLGDEARGRAETGDAALVALLLVVPAGGG